MNDPMHMFFKGNNIQIHFRVEDFWSWAYSDMLSNAQRGVLAEFIVMKALGIESEKRVEWDAYDLKTKDGTKIEVKSAAYLQSWEQKKHSEIKFNIAPTRGWHAETNEYSNELKRQADHYVFSLLDHKDESTVDPLNLDQWVFFVLPTKVLNDQLPDQKTITLNSLLKLKPVKCNFDSLKEFQFIKS